MTIRSQTSKCQENNKMKKHTTYSQRDKVHPSSLIVKCNRVRHNFYHKKILKELVKINSIE
jgi:hypothetical protein